MLAAPPRAYAPALLLALVLLAPPAAGSPELQQVLESTVVTPPARVAFREERHNPLLKEPMVLTGYLEYLRAGTLRKVIEEPFAEAFLIEAEQVVIERDGDTRALPLRKSKSLRTILGAIEAILAGDAARLETVFDLDFAGDREAWTVRLTPISRRIGKRLQGLEVGGDLRSVTSIRIDLRDGEWHVMEILRDETQP